MSAIFAVLALGFFSMTAIRVISLLKNACNVKEKEFILLKIYFASGILFSASYQLNMLIDDQNNQPLSHCSISNQGVAL